MKTIGFIGLGVMGRGMAANLKKAGFDLRVYTRTKSSAESLLKMGAQWCNTVAEVAHGCEAVITIIGYPKDVEETYLGENGLVNSAAEGTVLIDMTTSKPSLAKRIHTAAAEHGIGTLDAPVSGSDIYAASGELSIMVGGDRTDFERALPLFEAMGRNIVYQGEAGSGQYTKMANQIAIASTMMGVCEAIRYAEEAGLDPQSVLKSIESGAAGSWSMSNLVPRMLAGNFAPGFFAKHMLKDLKIAIESAEELNFHPQGLALAYRLYTAIAEAGDGDCGTQVLYKYC